MVWQLAVAALVSGVASASAQRSAGRRALRGARANADELIATSKENIALLNQSAEFNAGQALEIGFANYESVLAARDENVDLMIMESRERMRQHIRQEATVAGTIRAMSASSGIEANVGTPRYYLGDQMDEMLRSREYLAEVEKRTIFNYYNQMTRQADVIRLEAELEADSIIYNTDIQGQISMNEAETRANSMIRSGQVANSNAQAQSIATLINAGTDAYGYSQ